jgi:hypothetical protein
MQPSTDPKSGLRWLQEQGLIDSQISGLNPCQPGEFTMQNTYYVNSATPGVVYHGTEEGTLPMVPGRWYLLPATIAEAQPRLTANTVSVARAVRLTR